MDVEDWVRGKSVGRTGRGGGVLVWRRGKSVAIVDDVESSSAGMDLKYNDARGSISFKVRDSKSLTGRESSEEEGVVVEPIEDIVGIVSWDFVRHESRMDFGRVTCVSLRAGEDCWLSWK